MKFLFWKKEAPKGQRFLRTYLWPVLTIHLLGGIGVGLLLSDLIPKVIAMLFTGVFISVLVLTYLNAYLGEDKSN